jgi:protein TonB
MPAPVYPAAARRGGQTGTVLVEFTVDSSGRVISAVAKSPSPWPLLNAEAVRTVRKWRFPPGGIMKLQRPIVFQLR